MGFLEFISGWVNSNPGKAAGAFLGFIISVLLFTLGVVKTLLVLMFMAIGYFIGKSKDDNVPLVKQVTGIFKRDKNVNSGDGQP